MPAFQWVTRLPGQFLGRCPFDGDIRPTRVRIINFGTGRPALPFPHPWNYTEPLRILDSYFWGSEREQGSGRHNRYLDFPGFAPVLVTRDPAVIRAITTETGDQTCQFERDTMPSVGIARATGADTLLYANGSTWRRQRKLAAPPFGKTSLFRPETFEDFAHTFRGTVARRLEVLRAHLDAIGQEQARVRLEPEIKAVMLELLVNNFFGTDFPYEDIRNQYVPALERVIDHIVRDTVTNRIGVRVWKLPGLSPRIAQAKDDYETFEKLTNAVLATRAKGAGLWKQFKSDAPDEMLRSNIKVFLAGALEATSSYAGWAISHLSRNLAAQDRVAQEVQGIDEYTPENLERATYFGHALEETLRLTPSLYFLPRRATADTWITTGDGRRMFIPGGTHILLDIWHANRHEDHWGRDATGYAALDYVPERWSKLSEQKRGSKEVLHFGFGHGPRVCPGKHLGQLEVALVVGAFVKVFKFRAVNEQYEAKAGVSTKPLDGTLVDLQRRQN